MKSPRQVLPSDKQSMMALQVKSCVINTLTINPLLGLQHQEARPAEGKWLEGVRPHPKFFENYKELLRKGCFQAPPPPPPHPHGLKYGRVQF